MPESEVHHVHRPDRAAMRLHRWDGGMHRRSARHPTSGRHFQRYGGALALSALTTLLALPLQHVFELSNIVMLFLLVTVAAALLFGRGAAVVAAVVNVLAFDFF